MFNSIKAFYKELTAPLFIRVDSSYDLPGRYTRYNMWDVIKVSDEKILKKIYHHITKTSRIYYYCSDEYVECTVKTKKFSWCYLEVHYDLNFTKFGVYRNGLRYDISYSMELQNYMPLYKFLYDLAEKASKEYQDDRNL